MLKSIINVKNMLNAITLKENPDKQKEATDSIT